MKLAPRPDTFVAVTRDPVQMVCYAVLMEVARQELLSAAPVVAIAMLDTDVVPGTIVPPMVGSAAVEDIAVTQPFMARRVAVTSRTFSRNT